VLLRATDCIPLAVTVALSLVLFFVVDVNSARFAAELSLPR
jgi:hypothetical protein